MEKDILNKARKLTALCDAIHLLIEGTYKENDKNISHKALSLDGGIHQLSHIIRDESKNLNNSLQNIHLNYKRNKNEISDSSNK